MRPVLCSFSEMVGRAAVVLSVALAVFVLAAVDRARRVAELVLGMACRDANLEKEGIMAMALVEGAIAAEAQLSEGSRSSTRRACYRNWRA